jgi:hypothetical protein
MFGQLNSFLFLTLLFSRATSVTPMGRVRVFSILTATSLVQEVDLACLVTYIEAVVLRVTIFQSRQVHASSLFVLARRSELLLCSWASSLP